MKTVLVTGGAGFIGSRLCEKLISENYKVVCVDDFNDFYPVEFKKENIKKIVSSKNFKLLKGDICDRKKLASAFDSGPIDIVVHLAARAGVRPSIKNPKLYAKVNILGTINLLGLSVKNRVKQFIFGSSSSVYGEQKKVPFSEEDNCNQPISPYAASKKTAEDYCYFYHHLYEIPITVLRFFTVYGPRGRPDMAPYLFTKAILQGNPINMFGNGSSSRDYTYIDDIVRGIMIAIKHPFPFEIINLGNSCPIKLKDFIKLIEKISGRKAKIKRLPIQPGDVERTFANIIKAKRLLGWQPKIPLEKGMKKFIKWFEKERL